MNRCQADESLLADILVKKFGDHLPLYRQAEIMSCEGIYISRQTLCQSVLRAGSALKLLYSEMLGQILKSGNIFYDETPVNMLMPGKGKTHKAYYTKHAFARLDNNPAERAICPLAIGRKNWLFVGNEDGGESAAILLSLIQNY